MYVRKAVDEIMLEVSEREVKQSRTSASPEAKKWYYCSREITHCI